ncbi:MAG: TetR/AcrR family transcriptional regulator [Burkholderiaceae bacterium]
MIIIMRKSSTKPATPRAAAKDATHDRIVDVAARAIRRSGYDGTGVADIMKEAGLTHGAFYAHFDSRAAMLAEAAECAFSQAASAMAALTAEVEPDKALESLLAGYLSKAHQDQVDTGCPLAALGSETARQSPEVRRVATRHARALIDLVARLSPDWGQPGSHERALVTVSTMVGALLLARAVDDPALAGKLRHTALEHLTERAH